MTGRRVTPASITMIPIIIAIAIALAGVLIVNKVRSDEPSQCNELAALLHDLDRGTKGTARQGLDSVRVACR